MADETTVGMEVEWNGDDLGTHVSEATLDVAGTMVDCTALADEITDNRLGTITATGTITVVLKSDTPPEIEVGDVGELTIDGESAQVIVQSVGKGGGVNAPRTLRLAFTSTSES